MLAGSVNLHIPAKRKVKIIPPNVGGILLLFMINTCMYLAGMEYLIMPNNGSIFTDLTA